MYTAAYIRVSTGMQATEGTSLEGQETICLTKANELGVPSELIKVYKEEGFTGEDIDRPAMNELRQDIVEGKICRLIISHPDRLTRDLTDKLILCRELDKKNVDLQFVDTEYKNTPEGHLFFNLMSSIAQYELSLIKKRTVRGRLKAVEKGKKIMPMRVAPYGYDLINSSLVINETEAQFVRKIYSWYIYESLTLRDIGERLYSLGAIPKRAESKNWGASSIRRILSSEIYIGRYYYNKRKSRKVKGEKTKSGAPKKTYDIRDEKDWIMVEVPRLIDDSLFNLAQQQKEKNTKKSGNVKYEYLLKSILRCGHCGRLWQATTYSGSVNKHTGERMKYTCYRCPNLFPKRYGEGVEKCPTQTLRVEMLDDYIWSQIIDTISNAEEYVQRLQGNFNKIVNELKSSLELLQKQLEQKEREKEKIKIMFKREVIDEEEMFEEMKKINSYTSKLEIDLNKYQDQISVEQEKEMSSNRIKEFSLLIEQFIDNGGSQLSFKDKRHIVETLVDEVLIKFCGDEVQIITVGFLHELKKQRFLQHDHDIASCSQPQEV